MQYWQANYNNLVTTKDFEIKTVKNVDDSYYLSSNYKQFVRPISVIDENKILELKDKINSFAACTTREEALDNLKQHFSECMEEEKHTISIGYAKCIIINTQDKIRITYDSDKEFICYDFSADIEELKGE